jgi:hypothetical protein
MRRRDPASLLERQFAAGVGVVVHDDRDDSPIDEAPAVPFAG